jgi:hypothetical protein
MLLTISILCTVISGVGALNGHADALLLFPSAFIALGAHFRLRELERRLSEDRGLTASQPGTDTLLELSVADTVDWVHEGP